MDDMFRPFGLRGIGEMKDINERMQNNVGEARAFYHGFRVAEAYHNVGKAPFTDMHSEWEQYSSRLDELIQQAEEVEEND